MIICHGCFQIIVFPYPMPDRQNGPTMNTDGHQCFPAEPPSKQGLYDPTAESDACGVGFVVHQKGRKSHDIVAKALQVLINLEHRGACGCEANTGDGAGILIQTPDAFLRAVVPFSLPAPGAYAAGLVFLPPEERDRETIKTLIGRITEEEGQRLLGWRDVPTDDRLVGPSARAAQPVFEQVFIGASAAFGAPDLSAGASAKAEGGPRGSIGSDAAARFERKLYVIRKRVERAVDALKINALARRAFYVVSLSANTLIYKGMLTAQQLGPMFPDLLDERFESALALVHQRFSTNTFPSWPLAHPYRMIAHNGEINTLRGNINWMRAREGLLQSDLLGDDLQKLLPVIREGGSDTATFDNVLEMLVMAGRSLPHAILMMIPEPWSGNEEMAADRKAFYEYHSSLMEPWDGPASIAFTDGTVIGAVLDRNGLRPSRYYVTKDDLVVMASEVGVLDIPPADVLVKERLHPGKIFLVDTAKGRIVDDEEIKSQLAAEHPYREWIDSQLYDINELPAARAEAPEHETVFDRQQTFGYTQEDLRLLIGPMAQTGEEPLGSMGTDAALAVLSDKPRLLYEYFKQLFAQVTNPPLDAIREELVTSMGSTIGPERNLFKPERESCRQIFIKYPIIHNEHVAKLRNLPPDVPFRSTTLSMLFDPSTGGEGLAKAMDDLCRRASDAVKDGYDTLILSDRGVSHDLAPIPSLLATAGVHHHLVREGTRTMCALVVESGDAREVHHVALLIGYGAGVVNPYVAFETIDDMIRQGTLPGIERGSAGREKAIENYMKALNKGVLKVMSKMGISTLQSYCGAQIFEAIGLSQSFIDRYFTHTTSRVGGVGIEVIAEEVARRHDRAFGPRPVQTQELEPGGEYQWRRDGEYHLFNPETVFKLQHATRTGQYQVFKEYTQAVDRQNAHRATLRGLFRLRPASRPVPIDEVEPVETIVKRFATGAMSYGSISGEAHETLAIAMNRLGGKSNTGEGGEDAERFLPMANGDSKRSAIKQVASGRFGVTSEFLVNSDELQIKMAQGAKPGEGGQLPGHKVYPWIAKTRHSTPGVGLISPPPHHDIYSIEDLAQLIFDLKNSNKYARISVKLVAEGGVGTVAAGVAKAHSDVVLISGHDGGTGASPLTSLKHAGLPWELGLAETQQVLVLNKLRDRIVVQVDGQMKTGRDVVIGALLGAEEFGFATAPLVVMGCIMMRVCHLNTCPVGIATQDPEAAREVHGQAGVRRELLPLHRRRSARAHGVPGLPHPRRDDRPRRLPRRRAGARPLEGEGARPGAAAAPAGPAAVGGAPLRHGAGSWPGRRARQLAHRQVPQGARLAHAGGVHDADPELGSHRRHDARRRGDPPLRRRRPARRHHQAHLHGVGRPELRGVRAARHDDDPRGRRQRRLRQGPLGRPAVGVPAARVHLPVRGEHRRRQRGAVRRDERRGLRPRHGRRAVLRAQQRRARRGGGRGRPRLRIHDRRAGGRARQDRAQLRRGHERRRGLRPRRGRQVQKTLQHRDGRSRGARRRRRNRSGADARDAARRRDRQRLRGRAAGRLGVAAGPSGEGDAARVQARAGRAGGA